MYRVLGRYRGRQEELDSFDNELEAERMASEYRIAFGAGWSIWIVEG